ncbi:MAG: ATP-binding protein [Rhodothermales bacterium]
MQKLEIRVENRLSEIEVATEKFCEFVKKYDLPDEVQSKVSIILDELLTNTISYGSDDEEEHFIELHIEIQEDRLFITLADDGTLFNPFQHAAPDTEAAVDEREIGGLGIHIVRNMMQKVGYKRSGNRNVVTLT